MTIADKLTLLASSKEALRVKLGLPESLPFSEYYKLAIRKPFEPSDLFIGGEQGVWYDPSDKSTLFQDVAGTVPVTKDGDPVALMRDKSGNNNHVTQSVVAARPLYKTDGNLHWLQFDGVDDNLTSNLFIMPQPFSVTLSMITTKANELMNYFDSLQGDRVVLWSNGGSIAYGLFAGRDVKSGLGVPYMNKDTVTCLFNGSTSSVTNLAGKVENLNPGINALSGIIIGARTGATSGFVPISLYSFILSEGEHANNTRSFSNIKAGVTI